MNALNALDELIEHHRAQYRDELNISRMVSRQPPTSLDRNTGLMDEEPASAAGMTISGALLRRLGHPEGYGAVYPWMRALWLSRVECRRRHPHHRSAERPYWRGSLCHQAAKLVVIGGEAHGIGPMTVEQASGVLRVDRMEPLLRNVFRYIEEVLKDFRKAAEKRAREDEGQALMCVCGHSQSRHPRTVEWSCLDFNGVKACSCKRYRADNKVDSATDEDEVAPDWLMERKRYFIRARAMGVQIYDPRHVEGAA